MADYHARKAGAEFARNLARQQASQTQRALTGKKYDDGSVLLIGSAATGDLLTDGRKYIRVGSADAIARAAWNMATVDEVNLPVWVDRNPKGQYRILSVIEDEAYQQYGAGAAAKNSPGISTTDIIPSSRIAMGRPKLYSASGAIGSTGLVIVVDGFTYLNSNGQLAQWNAGSGSLDLTGSVPASAGYHTLALIALNPSATAPALTVTTQTARQNSWPFTPADYPSFSLTPGYIPLFAYELRNGDTTFLASRCDYNVRLFLSAYRPSCRLRVTDTATNYTVLLSDELICVTNTGAARTITLPAASTCFASGFGQTFTIADKSGGASVNNITAVTVGGDTLLGTGVISTNYGKIVIQAVSATEFLIL